MSGNNSSTQSPQPDGDRAGGPSTPGEESQPGDVGAGSAPGQADPKSPYTREDRSLISDLIRRRVPQVLAGYLGVTWTIFELMQWVTEKYLISPYLGRAILFGLLMLLPAVVLVTYRHGRPGPDRWTSLERWSTAANVLLALVVLGFAYGDDELGSMVNTVQAGPGADTTDEASSAAVRRVPKKEFRKRVSLFYFDEAEGTEADTALRRVAANALRMDLDQDNFISTRFIHWHSNRLRERNYGHGLGVPLALKREIAQWEESEYILSGSVGRTGGRFRLTTRLYETKTGGQLSEHAFEGRDLFPLVDRATKQIKEDLQLPQTHRESTADLPVTQVFTSSLEAGKRFAAAYQLRSANTREKDRRALENYRRAVEIDSTFALAHAGEGTLHQAFGRQEKARQSFRKARRHDYRLSESEKYWVKTVWLSAIERRLEEALRVSERWTELHPHDSRGWEMKADIHEDLLEYRATLESYQNALEVFPNSKNFQLEVGEWLINTGNLQDAARHLTSLTEKYSEDPAVYTWLGIARWKLGRLESAEKTFKKAERMDRGAVDERWTSRLYQATGRFEKTLEILQPSTRGEEADRKNGYSLFYHHWLRGRVEKSRSVLDSLWTADVSYTSLHRYYLSQRACNYRRDGNGIAEKDKYISHIKDFRERYGNSDQYDVLSRVGLANCFAAADRFELARRHLAVADSIVDQTEPSLRLSSHLDFFTGRVHEEMGNHSQAADRYERFLKVHAGHPTSLLWSVGRPRLRLALTYQKAGNQEKAQEAYQNALTLYPAHPDLNLHYGRFLVEQNETEQAREHLRRAVKGWARADSSFAPKQRARALLDSLGTNAV